MYFGHEKNEAVCWTRKEPIKTTNGPYKPLNFDMKGSKGPDIAPHKDLNDEADHVVSDEAIRRAIKEKCQADADRIGRYNKKHEWVESSRGDNDDRSIQDTLSHNDGWEVYSVYNGTQFVRVQFRQTFDVLRETGRGSKFKYRLFQKECEKRWHAVSLRCASRGALHSGVGIFNTDGARVSTYTDYIDSAVYELEARIVPEGEQPPIVYIPPKVVLHDDIRPKVYWLAMTTPPSPPTSTEIFRLKKYKHGSEW